MGDHTVQRGSDASGVPRTQPWAALALGAFGLHWTWEMLQGSLYASMKTLSLANATWQCTAASIGDVVITLFAYGIVAAGVGSRTWLLHARLPRVTAYLVTGLVITVALEMLNVQYLNRWSYAPSMPLVLGVGLAPLAQWFVVPIASLWIARRYIRRVALRRSSTDVA